MQSITCSIRYVFWLFEIEQNDYAIYWRLTNHSSICDTPPLQIWIRPCSNHWEKEKSGASTCLKASFECGIEGWSNGCQPENFKAPPHPQTQTGSPGKQDRNRQSRETVRPPPAINKPMQGLLFTWRNPFVHIFFSFIFIGISYNRVWHVPPMNWLCKLHEGNMWFHYKVHTCFM